MGLEKHREGWWGGWGCMFSYFLLPSFSLSPDRLSLHLCCRLAFDQRSHTLSRGIDRRERRERGLDEVWRKRQFQFCSHLNQFRINSITSYCDSHFGGFGWCKGCKLETAGGNGQHFVVGCFSRSVNPHYPSTV